MFGDGGRKRQARVLHVGLPRLGQTEVEHLDRAVRADLDVGGFEVAVDDALSVGGFKCLSDAERDRRGFADGDDSAFDPLVQSLALHQLHDQEVDLRALRLLGFWMFDI